MRSYKQGIAAKFGSGTDQGCRLLFWYDSEQSFKDAITELDLPDVTVLDMTGLSIIRGLVSDLTGNAKGPDRTQFESLLSRRLLGHWCLSRKDKEDPIVQT